jgi:hypothetical protein
MYASRIEADLECKEKQLTRTLRCTPEADYMLNTGNSTYLMSVTTQLGGLWEQEYGM